MGEHNPFDSYTNLRCGITIYPAQDKEIDRVLSDLVQKIPAVFVMLTDVTGQIISVRGERGRIDIIALSSLVAGDLAASQEIARLTGEYQTYQMVVREGQRVNSFICEAGRYLVMFVQVSAEVPMGWARLLINAAGRKLDIILHTPVEVEARPKLEIKSDENLPDLFDDAFDDLLAG